MKKFEQFSSTIRVSALLIFGIAATIIYYFIWNAFYNLKVFEHPYIGTGKLFIIAVYFIILIVCGVFLGASRIDKLRKGEIIFNCVVALIFTDCIAYSQVCLIASKFVNIIGMVYILICQAAFLLLWVYASFSIVHSLNPPEKMLIIFGSHQATELVYKMSKIEERFVISESVSVDEGYDEIIKKVDKFDSIIICDVPARLRNDILKYCYDNNKNIYVVPKISDILLRSASDVTYFDSPLINCKSNALTIEQRFFKRLFDILFSLFALIIFSPIFAVVALCIKCYDRGPVFYKQKRCTLNLKEFDILKFRSMVIDAEKDGPQPAVKNDKRITPIGKFIRDTRIDELPQLINILRGDMSVVGPRPERIEHVSKYCAQIPEFVFRYKVKGGLTGYAQVFGKYNTKPYDKLKMDLIYIQNYSVALDVKLIIMTVRILFSKESTEGFKEKTKGKN